MSWIEAEIAFRVGAINRQIISRAKRGTACLRNSASQVLGQNGSGRVYGRHIASAPGQPPAPDSGSLRRHWREAAFAQANGLGRGIDVKLRITSDVFYQVYLERGTGRGLAPRPHIERIKSKAAPEIQAIFSGI